jgi:hypothetical protein
VRGKQLEHEIQPNGVMIGFIQLPCGSERDVAMYGTIQELIAATALLGLHPDVEQIMQMERGESVKLLYFSDGHGSHVTLQPVNNASDFLARSYQ